MQNFKSCYSYVGLIELDVKKTLALNAKPCFDQLAKSAQCVNTDKTKKCVICLLATSLCVWRASKTLLGYVVAWDALFQPKASPTTPLWEVRAT